MIGTIIKLVILAVAILVGLKIFAPNTADKVLDQISQTTGVEKNILDDSLNKATDITKDSANKLLNKAQDGLETAKDKIKDKIDE